MAHTRPRREKKVVEFCSRHAIAATLPCYDSAHKYRGKTVVFRKPLFPGYVFLQLNDGWKQAIRQNEHVAALLDVFDQETFQRQLQDILLALDAKLGVRLAPAIGEGTRVARGEMKNPPGVNRRAAPFKKCDARPEYASRISEQRNLS